MLVCYYQHCICLMCVQSIFQYSPSLDEVCCPFCKEPMEEHLIDKFRLVEELVDASKGIDNYDKEMKEHLKEL